MLNAAKFTRVYGHMTEFWGGGEMGGVGGGGVGVHKSWFLDALRIYYLQTSR